VPGTDAPLAGTARVRRSLSGERFRIPNTHDARVFSLSVILSLL
jgi:hypothetical protein